jgi:NADPH2:quinone reductase
MNTQVNTSTMNAIQMRGFGSSDLFAIKELPKPSPQEGEVQIRIKAAAFNPVDYKIRQGWYKGDSERILGFDCSGIIDAVGTGVSNFKVGDEVYAMTIKSSNGSYAEFVSLPAIFVAKKPASLSFEQAAATPLAAMTAYRATIAASAFKKTDVVFVAGIGGGVGSFAIQFLRKIGVKEIFTIAKDQESA